MFCITLLAVMYKLDYFNFNHAHVHVLLHVAYGQNISSVVELDYEDSEESYSSPPPPSSSSPISEVKLDKSNILLLGPTGCGKY